MGFGPARHQRPRELPHIGAGVQRPADPLRHHHDLLQQQQLRLGRHSEILGRAKQLPQQPPQRDFAGRQAANRLADGPQRLRERPPRTFAGHEAHREMRLRDPRVVAFEKPREHVGEKAPRRPVETAHDAEIHQPQRTVRGDENVPRMRVAMEKAVAEDLVERRPRRARDDVGGVVAGRGESFGVAQRRALDALGGEHPPRRPPPVHLRNPRGSRPRRNSPPAPTPPRLPETGSSRPSQRRRKPPPIRRGGSAATAGARAPPRGRSGETARDRAGTRARCRAATP